MKKDVLIIGEFPPPYDGIGVQSETLHTLLKKSGLEVDILRTNIKPDSPLKKIPVVRAIIYEIIFIILLFKKIIFVRNVHILAGSFLSFYLFAVPPIIVGKFLRKNLILHYHGGGLKEFLKDSGAILRFIFNLVDHIVVPSGFLKNIFDQYGIKSMIIPNIVESGKFKFAKKDKILPIYLSVRYLREIYNVKSIVEAMKIVCKRFPDAKLIIAGEGEQMEDIRDYITKNQLTENISLIGNIPNEQMASLYQKAYVLVNASIVDNAPVSLIEAMFSGLLIISSRAGGIPYMVKHNETAILVEKPTKEKLAEAMINAVLNQEKSLEIIQNAYRQCQIYNWEYIKKLWFKIYLV